VALVGRRPLKKQSRRLWVAGPAAGGTIVEMNNKQNAQVSLAGADLTLCPSCNRRSLYVQLPAIGKPRARCLPFDGERACNAEKLLPYFVGARALDDFLVELPDETELRRALLSEAAARAAANRRNGEAERNHRHERREEASGDFEEDSPLWRPFPLDLLPGPFADLVSAGAAAIPCDPAMMALPALAVLSAAAGSGARIRLKRSWVEPATFWCVVAAPSGTAKSAALELVLRPIYELEAEAAARYRADREVYEQRLKEWRALSKEERVHVPEPEPPRSVRYRLSDATLEAVAAVHRDNPRGVLLARDELSGWIASFDRYAQTRGGDLASWLELYEGRPVVVDRKTDPEPIRIERPHVPVVGTVQPWLLRERVSPELLASGFVARLTIAIPPEIPRRFSDADVDETTEAAYARLVRRLYQVGEVELSLSIEARRLFGVFVEEMDQERRRLPDGPLRSASAKIEAKAARLALLFQLCEDVQAGRPSREISPEAMQRAIELAHWLWYETRRVYGLMRWSGLSYAALHRSPAERLLDQLPAVFSTADWLQVAKTQSIPRRTAERWLSQLIDARRIERIQKGAYRKFTPMAVGGNGGSGGTLPEKSTISATTAIRQMPESVDEQAGVAPPSSAPGAADTPAGMNVRIGA